MSSLITLSQRRKASQFLQILSTRRNLANLVQEKASQKMQLQNSVLKQQLLIVALQEIGILTTLIDFRLQPLEAEFGWEGGGAGICI